MVARHAETPTMASTARQSMAYAASDFSTGVSSVEAFGRLNPISQSNVTSNATGNNWGVESLLRQQFQQHQEVINMAVVRRVVQVIIADTNENIPLGDCILHKGDEQVTDLTDQELFFELDIKNMLATHNEKRTKIVDKKVKDRVEHLEPAKIRDLKMVVVLVTNL